MRIAIGADHAGLRLKNELREALRQAGHDVTDCGTNSPESTDYPDYARQVGETVASKAADRGVLVCHSGVGMSIAANKIRGIRAALGAGPEEVRLSRAHNDANVLALGQNFTDTTTAWNLTQIFLETPFDGGRHERRVNKISALEHP